MDCSSLTELMLSEACGFTGSDIMFSSNQTPVEDMKKAYELGAYINLDDATMVDFLDRVAGIPENIFCRYNPGGTFQLGDSEEGFQVMDKPGDAKYGMTEEQMIESYKKLMAKGAKNFGIHAFLASNTSRMPITRSWPPSCSSWQSVCRRPPVPTSATSTCPAACASPTAPTRPRTTSWPSARACARSLRRFWCPPAWVMSPSSPRWAALPPAPYGALVATAIHEKHIYKEYIGLDACAANLMRPAMYGAYHHVTVMGKENAACDHMYDVVGSLCENNDKFAIDRMLPKIDIGDLIYIHDTGAHGSAMGYNYNGKLRSAEVLLCEDGSHRLIRRAETPRDYFATLDFLPAMKPLFEGYDD